MFFPSRHRPAKKPEGGFHPWAGSRQVPEHPRQQPGGPRRVPDVPRHFPDHPRQCLAGPRQAQDYPRHHAAGPRKQSAGPRRRLGEPRRKLAEGVWGQKSLVFAKKHPFAPKTAIGGLRRAGNGLTKADSQAFRPFYFTRNGCNFSTSSGGRRLGFSSRLVQQ